MPSGTDSRDRILGLLLPFGPVVARAMFGGYGLYLDGLMFGLIAYDTPYLKVDDENRDDFVNAGTGPFTYEGKKRPVQMSYYQIPGSVLNDPDELAKWADRAYQAARRARAKKPPRRSKNKADKARHLQS